MKRFSCFLLMTLLVFPAAYKAAGAVQQERISPYMLFSYLKNSESVRILQAKMTNITMTGEVPLPGLEISFYNGGNLLGNATTDATGLASLAISDTVTLARDDDGTWTFTCEFTGDDRTEETISEITITDVNLEMTLTEEDGTKNVILHATFPDTDNPLPVTGEEISLFVPRMFSLMPVATGVLDDDGYVTLTFPGDIPGDSLGNITVIGRFNDHYLFGNVEKRESRMWGTQVSSPPPIYRSLWSTLAPKWMVFTLAAMLLGVWSHYMYVIISLLRIRRDSRKNANIDLAQ